MFIQRIILILQLKIPGLNSKNYIDIYFKNLLKQSAEAYRTKSQQDSNVYHS